MDAARSASLEWGALAVADLSATNAPGGIFGRRGPAMSRSATITVILAIVGTVLWAGCGGDEGPGEAPAGADTPLSTYVGEVTLAASESEPAQPAPKGPEGQPGSAYIAVITDGDRISGFVTDGEKQAKWFATNELEDEKSELIARDGSSLGEVTVTEDAASGEVAVGLGTGSFEAEPAIGNTGLFSAAEADGDDSFEAGWIVLGPGEELGSYDTFIEGEFKTQPAPRLAPTVKIPGFGAQAPAQLNSLFFDSNVQAP